MPTATWLGRSVQVGTFNKHLADAGHGDKVRNPWDSTAEEDFGGENAASSEDKTEETARKKPGIVIAAGDLPRITRKVKRFLMAVQIATIVPPRIKFLGVAVYWHT